MKSTVPSCRPHWTAGMLDTSVTSGTGLKLCMTALEEAVICVGIWTWKDVLWGGLVTQHTCDLLLVWQAERLNSLLTCFVMFPQFSPVQLVISSSTSLSVWLEIKHFPQCKTGCYEHALLWLDSASHLPPLYRTFHSVCRKFPYLLSRRPQCVRLTT